LLVHSYHFILQLKKDYRFNIKHAIDHSILRKTIDGLKSTLLRISQVCYSCGILLVIYLLQFLFLHGLLLWSLLCFLDYLYVVYYIVVSDCTMVDGILKYLLSLTSFHYFIIIFYHNPFPSPFKAYHLFKIYWLEA